MQGMKTSSITQSQPSCYFLGIWALLFPSATFTSNEVAMKILNRNSLLSPRQISKFLWAFNKLGNPSFNGGNISNFLSSQTYCQQRFNCCPKCQNDNRKCTSKAEKFLSAVHFLAQPVASFN
jgi:hypothetical protein